MSSEPGENILALWNEYGQTLNQYQELRRSLLRALRVPDTRKSLVEILRPELADFRQRFLLLEVVEWFPTLEQQMLIEELLPLATMHETKWSFNRAAKIVLSWEPEWLKTNLETHARNVLARIIKGEHTYTNLAEYYSGLIEIYRHVDPGKAREFAEEAISSSNAEVRDVGDFWINEYDWTRPSERP
jgi:hypothetical protein